MGMVLIIATAYVISSRWFQLILIQGESMHPACHHLQPAVLDKRNCEYQAGDVVAFRCSRLQTILVKRIAACPGDRLQIAAGTLLVNGEVSRIYQYQRRGIFTYAGIAATQKQLQEGEYFVLGDNLAKSIDSRYEEVGMVNADAILGRVVGCKKVPGG